MRIHAFLSLKTLDSRTLWDALAQRPFFRTVSHVEVTASHRDGDGMGTTEVI